MNNESIIQSFSTRATAIGSESVGQITSEGAAGKEPRTQDVVTLSISELFSAFQSRSISEQGGADQPATASESKPSGDSKPQPEAGARPQ